MEFSQNGSVLAMYGPGLLLREVENSLSLWSVSDGRHIRTFRGKEADEKFALSRDGKVLAVPNDQEGVVVIRDVAGGKELHRLKHSDVWDVYFSPVGNVLASISFKGGSDRTGDELLVWDAATGLQLYATTSQPAIRTAFAADGRLLFWGYDRRLRCWDPVTQKERSPVLIPPDTDRRLTQLPSGDEVLAADLKSGRIQLHDARTWKVLREFVDGKDVLVASTDAIFTPGSEVLAAEVKVEATAFTREGKRLVVGLDNGRIEVWDTVTGKRRSSFIGSDPVAGFFLCVDPVPDGKHVMVRRATPDSDGSAVFTHTALYTLDGQLVRRVPEVRNVVFDPSGRSVAVWHDVPGDPDRPNVRALTVHDAAAWLPGR